MKSLERSRHNKCYNNNNNNNNNNHNNNNNNNKGDASNNGQLEPFQNPLENP
jgi:hypothetical protein